MATENRHIRRIVDSWANRTGLDDGQSQILTDASDGYDNAHVWKYGSDYFFPAVQKHTANGTDWTYHNAHFNSIILENDVQMTGHIYNPVDATTYLRFDTDLAVLSVGGVSMFDIGDIGYGGKKIYTTYPIHCVSIEAEDLTQSSDTVGMHLQSTVQWDDDPGAYPRAFVFDAYGVAPATKAFDFLGEGTSALWVSPEGMLGPASHIVMATDKWIIGGGNNDPNCVTGINVNSDGIVTLNNYGECSGPAFDVQYSSNSAFKVGNTELQGVVMHGDMRFARPNSTTKLELQYSPDSGVNWYTLQAWEYVA